MKKAKVIAERKCGLKILDTVLTVVPIDAVLDRAIDIARASPNTWSGSWGNAHWATMNAVQNIYDEDLSIPRVRNNGQMWFNLDECFSPEQIQKFAAQCGYTEPFEECWERK